MQKKCTITQCRTYTYHDLTNVHNTSTQKKMTQAGNMDSQKRNSMKFTGKSSAWVGGTRGTVPGSSSSATAPQTSPAKGPKAPALGHSGSHFDTETFLCCPVRPTDSFAAVIFQDRLSRLDFLSRMNFVLSILFRPVHTEVTWATLL